MTGAVPYQPSDLLADVEDVAVVGLVLVIHRFFTAKFTYQHLRFEIACMLPEKCFLNRRLRGIEMVGPALLREAECFQCHPGTAGSLSLHV